MADYKQMTKDINDTQIAIQLKQEAAYLSVTRIANCINLGMAYAGSLFNSAVCGYSIAQHNDRNTIVSAAVAASAVCLAAFIGRMYSKDKKRAAEIREELKGLEARVEGQ